MNASAGRTTAAAGQANESPLPSSPGSAPRPRVRVLWLVKGLGPGGAERLLTAAAAVHDRDCFDLEAAYLVPAKDQLVPSLRAEGVRVHALARFGDLPGSWVARLRRLLRTGSFDVVHLHSPVVAGTARLLGLTIPRSRRPRFMTTEHNVWSAFTVPTRILNAATWALDDAHLAVSEDVRASVWPPRFADRTEVLVHGIDLDAARQARAHRSQVRQDLGAADTDVVVGTVANFRSHKAYPDLLDAARTVLAASPYARFVAVGQGPLEGEVRSRLAALGLGDRFLLLGYRDDPERVLAACDIFVLASHFEGYPVALMEALAIGLPVVATRVGGIPDAVREGVEGMLVSPGEPDRLAAALTTVVDDAALRERFAAAARERGGDFDIENAVRRLEALYRELAAQRP